MPAPVSLEQLLILERAIARYPEGGTLEQIAQGLTPPPSQRTLTRWLTILVERRRVERVGHTRAVRYRALHPPREEAARPAAVVASSEPMADPRASRRPAGMAACPPTQGADITEQIFAAAIGDIVRFRMSRATAVMVLQRMTELNIASVDDRRACFALLKARLAAFTEAEAERYGLESEQYRAWSEHDALMAAVAVGAGVEKGDGNEVGRAGSARRVEDVATNGGSRGPALPGPGGVARGAEVGRDRWARQMDAASKEGGLSTAFNAGERGGQRDGRFEPEGRRDACAPSGDPKNQPAPNDAVSGFQQTAADMKRLMTPGRLAVSALWAGGVSTAATHLVGGGAAQAVTFLVAGVPPLLFVDRDRVAANNPMDLRAKLTTLVAGGSGSMLCAGPVSYVFESAVGLFR